ncbi:MAG: hypothetical protein VYC64_02855 [Candidatus Latescibacterota bacterium]|nr:hypothetical protein [Candidatus Latescibacterota bacterium]
MPICIASSGIGCAGRLQREAALITTEDFVTVLEVQYRALTGDP